MVLKPNYIFIHSPSNGAYKVQHAQLGIHGIEGYQRTVCGEDICNLMR